MDSTSVVFLFYDVSLRGPIGWHARTLHLRVRPIKSFWGRQSYGCNRPYCSHIVPIWRGVGMYDREIIARLRQVLQEPCSQLQQELLHSLLVDGAGRRVVEILGEQSVFLLRSERPQETLPR